MQYRKEIDGLRAVAVMPVIFFHGGFGGFSGGYIGVDVFFVISGFLITSILIGEASRGTFSIVNFYERRARRILPALSIVLLPTTVAAVLLLPADLLKSYSQSLVSVATFLSNVFFYMTSGYFSTASDEKPLLHTWSLAVEEQYYIFFPLMISVLWFAGKKRILGLLILLSLASLVCSEYLSVTGERDANFYLIFSRAWELFAGSLIAFIEPGSLAVRRWQRELGGLAGLSLIVYSILFFDKNTPFPGLYALVPVLGTVLIIVFCDAGTYCGRILSNRVFVGIGLISYSLYLWHQPIFAFLRLKTIGEPSLTAFGIAIAVVFVLAYLSYHYIEGPFRDKKRVSRRTIFLFAACSISFFVTVGLLGHVFKGFENRFGVSTYEKSIQYSPKRESCHTWGKNYLRVDKACRYPGPNITWAAFGDSHVVEPAWALAKLLEKRDEGLLHLSFSHCAPALGFDVDVAGCSQWLRESLAWLETHPSIDHVFLGFRYSLFLYGDQMDDYPGVPDANPALHLLGDNKRLSRVQARELYWKGMRKLTERLLKAGKTVYVLYPVPELPVHISKAVTPFSVFGDKTMVDLRHATSRDYYLRRNQFILDRLDTLPWGDRLHAIKPFEILCQADSCPAVKDGKSLYFDDDHLSVYGAEVLIEGSGIEQSLQANQESSHGAGIRPQE